MERKKQKKLQFNRLERIFRLASPSTTINVVIYMHDVSRKEAKEIMKRMPRGFHKTSKVTESGSDWSEAIKSNVYGLGRLEVTVFYPKERR